MTHYCLIHCCLRLSILSDHLVSLCSLQLSLCSFQIVLLFVLYPFVFVLAFLQAFYLIIVPLKRYGFYSSFKF